jgi:iron complex outermembrane recepter protein
MATRSDNGDNCLPDPITGGRFEKAENVIMKNSTRGRLLHSTMMGTIIGGVALVAGFGASTAMAQDAAASAPKDEVVVTGSRIRRTNVKTSAPVTMIDAQTLTDRGIVQAGEMLNMVTSNARQYAVTPGNGSSSGSGQQFPNLFGMGAGRTLTLVNGRRYVTSQSGMDGNAVDTNMIPTGLIKRIDVVQAGGAAVYGSDAIAGVINYVLKDDFEGAELDVQTGISSRNDYNNNSVRGTFGKNFKDGKGNVALDVEWSKNDPLYWRDRPFSNLGRITVTNSANTSATDGIPSVRENLDTRFWEFNTNGVIFTTPAPVNSFILKTGGLPTQFSADGQGLSVYNIGVQAGVPFSSGGDGYSYKDLASLYTGVERFNTHLISHYDISEHMKLSGELSFSNTNSSDPLGAQASNTVLNAPATGAGYFTFTKTNAFLTPAQVTALSAASATFAAGGPLFMSKFWSDLLPSREVEYKTQTWRGAVSLDGDFDFADRNFYYGLSFTRGITDGQVSQWSVLNANFAKAVSSVLSGGAAVCSVNADASTTNDDAACSPLNPFGTGTVSNAARAYVTTMSGQTYSNTQDDFLATIGGNIIDLPAGAAKFSLAYEHRAEKATYDPYNANQLGLVGSGVKSAATRGQYNTNEYSTEILVPIFGGDFTLPFVKGLELNGAYRFVDNSIAGKEDVWGAGLRWEIVTGLSVRASQSRNFRAPTLTQLFAPSSTALGAISVDPCDADRINGGPAPATRLANCQALFAAHPGYGSLATFQDLSENFSNAMITTGGNANLKNEISNTKTIGVIFQPTFIPGLTLVADYLEVELENGLSAFTPQNFLATCYDSSPQPADVCSTFVRDATGQITSAVSTTYNAGRVTLHGETYNANYTFPVGQFFGDRALGRLELGVEATHLALYETSVTGFDLTRTDDTTAQPEWQTRADINYAKGPLRVSYSAYYLSDTQANRTDTIESTPTPSIKSNLRHSISAQYNFGKYTIRGGILNFTDVAPSYPTYSYGDIIGRQYYVGLKAKF